MSRRGVERESLSCCRFRGINKGLDRHLVRKGTPGWVMASARLEAIGEGVFL